MRLFKDIVDQVVAAEGGAIPWARKDAFTTYYLTHKGVLVGTSKDRDDFKGKTGAVEKAIDDDAYKAADKLHRDQQARISAIWDAELRAEYSHLNDATFSAIYSQAYDDGHSAGMDEVANYMIGYDDLARKIIAANA